MFVPYVLADLFVFWVVRGRKLDSRTMAAAQAGVLVTVECVVTMALLYRVLVHEGIYVGLLRWRSHVRQSSPY